MRMRWLAALLVAFAASCGGTTVSRPGGQCGGNTNSPAICPPGYTCASDIDGGPPVGDVGGICRKDGT